MSKVALPDAPGQALVTTYENTQPPQGEKSFVDRLLSRAERYAMLAEVREWVDYKNRLRVCMRNLAKEAEGVSVYLRDDRASYGGLMTCSSVWLCPICSAKITGERCQELGTAIEGWKQTGGNVYMVVLTVPHKRGDSLESVLERLGKAYRTMKNRKPWKRIMKQYGVVGTIRSLEVTYGANGWHAHFHLLLFVPAGISVPVRSMHAQILGPWIDANMGLYDSLPNARGVQVQDGNAAARYFSKWGLEHEMTRAHNKRGHGGNMTPWDLIRNSEKVLFLEYAEAFKYKRQLVWSDGLKELLGVKERTDEEIASEVEPEDYLLTILAPFQWRFILQAGLRAKLLEKAETEGYQGVKRLLQDLMETDLIETHQGEKLSSFRS